MSGKKGRKVPKQKVPVTLLSGFLGAGKTTLLSHILNNRKGLRVGLIINDMSEVNIDAQLIESGQASLSRVEDKVVELSNGCICCTLREDLLKVMISLASEGRFDYLVIESSGISEPLQVAETFTFDDIDEETGRSLAEVAYLDTCVTVVDGLNFLRDYGSGDSLAARDTAAYTGDERTVVDLLVDQVEFANVIIVNKLDLLGAEPTTSVDGAAAPSSPGRAEVERLKAILHHLNPAAKIVEAVRGNVPLECVLNTRLFSLEKASSAPGWLQELRGSHVPESVEYGITSFVYRAKRPFHPGRLHGLVSGGAIGPEAIAAWCKGGATCPDPAEATAKAAADAAAGTAAPIADPFASVIRSKGFFWLACDGGMDQAGIWAHAGRVFEFSEGRTWWAAAPKHEWPPRASPARAIIQKEVDADPTYGDRKQEIVFIGVKMDHAAVKACLDACLLTDEEFNLGPSGPSGSGDDGWDAYDDPFDFFPYEDIDEVDEEELEGAGAGGEGEAAAGGAASGGGSGGHVHHEGCSHDHAPSAPKHEHSEACEDGTCDIPDAHADRPQMCRIVRHSVAYN